MVSQDTFAFCFKVFIHKSYSRADKIVLGLWSPNHQTEAVRPRLNAPYCWGRSSRRGSTLHVAQPSETPSSSYSPHPCRPGTGHMLESSIAGWILQYFTVCKGAGRQEGPFDIGYSKQELLGSFNASQ